MGIKKNYCLFANDAIYSDNGNTITWNNPNYQPTSQVKNLKCRIVYAITNGRVVIDGDGNPYVGDLLLKFHTPSKDTFSSTGSSEILTNILIQSLVLSRFTQSNDFYFTIPSNPSQFKFSIRDTSNDVIGFITNNNKFLLNLVLETEEIDEK